MGAPCAKDALVGIDRDHGLAGAVWAWVGVCFVAERLAAVSPGGSAAVGGFDEPEAPLLFVGGDGRLHRGEQVGT